MKGLDARLHIGEESAGSEARDEQEGEQQDDRPAERFNRVDPNTINYELTVDDPKTYTKPWKNVRTFTLRPDWELLEYSCEENNKDLREGHIKAPTFGK